MKIHSIKDIAFQPYGKVLEDFTIDGVLEIMKNTPIPNDVLYIPSLLQLENDSIKKSMEMRLFGQLPIQIGYCNGHNNHLNAVEYHRTSEVNIAITDMILLLGKIQDISEDFTYDTKRIEAFYVPQGRVVELYATTLHYAPCQCSEGGFQCVIILPKGTNEDCELYTTVSKEDQLLFACNKWLIAHEEAKLDQAYIGLIGTNININEKGE